MKIREIYVDVSDRFKLQATTKGNQIKWDFDEHDPEIPVDPFDEHADDPVDDFNGFPAGAFCDFRHPAGLEKPADTPVADAFVLTAAGFAVLLPCVCAVFSSPVVAAGFFLSLIESDTEVVVSANTGLATSNVASKPTVSCFSKACFIIPINLPV